MYALPDCEGEVGICGRSRGEISGRESETREWRQVGEVGGFDQENGAVDGAEQAGRREREAEVDGVL